MELDAKKIRTLLLAPAILGISLMIGLGLLGYQIAASRSGDVITVTGSVKKQVTADLAKWNAEILRYGSKDEIKQTLAAVAADSEKVKKFIIKNGIEEKNITIGAARTESVNEQLPGYGYSPNIIGYNVHQEVKVESGDVGKIEMLAKASNSLVDQGIVLNFQTTEYYYTKLAELRPALFADATKDARERAEAIASGTGVKIGALRSAKTGVIQILPPNSMEISDYGSYDLSTKEKEITVTVNVGFALE